MYAIITVMVNSLSILVSLAYLLPVALCIGVIYLLSSTSTKGMSKEKFAELDAKRKR